MLFHNFQSLDKNDQKKILFETTERGKGEGGGGIRIHFFSMMFEEGEGERMSQILTSR